MDKQQYDFGLMAFPGQELHDVLRELKRQYGPVAQVKFLGLPAYIVNDYELLKSAFKNEKDFPPADIYRMFLEPLIGKTFQTMEGEEHRIYRQLATPSFKPSTLKHFDFEYLVDLGNELIDRFISDEVVDLTKQFTHLFPFIVISRLLGIPREREEAFQRWAVGILSFAGNPEEAKRCLDEMVAYLSPIIVARRENPGEDIISALTQVEVEGHSLSNEELLSTVHLMFSAGATTTHDAMGNMIYALLTTNNWKTVKQNPALVDEVVEETLRWETPVALLPRTASMENDVNLAGYSIPAGSIVLFALTGVNHSDAFYLEPDSFQLNKNTYNKVISFGHGYRMCPGLHLARLQLRAMLEVLLKRLPEDILLIDESASRPSGSTMRGPNELRVKLKIT